MKYVDLTFHTLKIFDVHFSYYKALQNKMNFLKTIIVLKLWRMWNLTLEGRIIISKTFICRKLFTWHFYLSGLYYLGNRKKKHFIWKHSRPKIQHKTLRMHTDLKNFNNCLEIASLQSSWARKLYNEPFHESKLIPLYFLEKVFGKSLFKLYFKNSILNYLPSYYHKVFTNWNLSSLHHTLLFLVF